MHWGAIALALLVPLIRYFVKQSKKVPYAANEAVHDGISAAALPSLFAMMMGVVSSEIITHINIFEFFAAGLLGIIQTVAQLFSTVAHGHPAPQASTVPTSPHVVH